MSIMRVTSLCGIICLMAVLSGCYFPYPHWEYRKPRVDGLIRTGIDEKLGGERSPLSGVKVWYPDSEDDHCKVEICEKVPLSAVESDAKGNFSLPGIRREYRYWSLYLPTALEYSVDTCLCFLFPNGKVKIGRATELLFERYPRRVELRCQEESEEVRCDCCELSEGSSEKAPTLF
ncbi:MAG: hypothetical protein KDD64_01225 [Bdellovibrionales bacterium]|nr:hypothetical protein [Bdellovibrionales bacterium]